MVVDNELWWSAWWFWVALWAATLGLIVAAGIVFWSLWRGRKRQSNSARIHGTIFFLHNTSVMDLYMYLYREHKPALRKEVEETIRRTKDGNLEVKVYGSGGKIGRDFNSEIVRKYVEEAESVPVLRSVIDTLDEAHEIVYADLRDKQLTRNLALDRVLVGAAVAGEQLSKVDVYVSVVGTFRKATELNGITVFLAPYGDPDDPESAPLVRVPCATTWLRDDVPEQKFRARCLGKVDGWDRDRGELLVRPIAIFR